MTHGSTFEPLPWALPMLGRGLISIIGTGRRGDGVGGQMDFGAVQDRVWGLKGPMNLFRVRKGAAKELFPYLI